MHVKLKSIIFSPLLLLILFHRYNANLMHAKNNAAKKGVVLGLTVSAFWFLVFSALSVAFYYGVKLMQDPDEDFDPGDTLTVSSISWDIYRLISFDIYRLTFVIPRV